MSSYKNVSLTESEMKKDYGQMSELTEVESTLLLRKHISETDFVLALVTETRFKANHPKTTEMIELFEVGDLEYRRNADRFSFRSSTSAQPFVIELVIAVLTFKKFHVLSEHTDKALIFAHQIKRYNVSGSSIDEKELIHKEKRKNSVYCDKNDWFEHLIKARRSKGYESLKLGKHEKADRETVGLEEEAIAETSVTAERLQIRYTRNFTKSDLKKLETECNWSS
ncbi:2833_t:CDS:2 [Paraglomus occultum]|uniref:2833_t:CDS:1 n=1 Tax=Paraglomus occultum TaxID=144539 RepID=A0A9N9C427_9GLOM|nr:2833_t:CDS:2 [Paraglomus occultum]